MYARANLARRMAAAAAPRRMLSDASHAPPKKLFGLTARYANAAYTAASKAGNLPTVGVEMESIAAVLQKNAAFAATLSNPTVGREAKVAYLDGILGTKYSPITKNLLLTMASNARLDELEKVAADFGELMKAKGGVVDATVTSAVALTAAQSKAIQKALEGTLAAGQTISLITEVDPKLLGGLQVQVGDKYMDLSVSSKIASIKRGLL
mmetsp:Transcript_30401/g.97004  ORF Transcript_30401/g.97004 Transcript_30401/m.97004 type:complete len:209 (-) Transcript_30401:25-651(-)